MNVCIERLVCRGGFCLSVCLCQTLQEIEQPHNQHLCTGKRKISKGCENMGLSETDGRNSLSVDVSHAVWRLSDKIRSVT